MVKLYRIRQQNLFLCKYHVSFHTYTSHNSFNTIISVKVLSVTHLAYLLSSQVLECLSPFGFRLTSVSETTSFLHITKAGKSNYIQFLLQSLSFYLPFLHSQIYLF
jgi:hypothetical protein